MTDQRRRLRKSVQDSQYQVNCINYLQRLVDIPFVKTSLESLSFAWCGLDARTELVLKVLVNLIVCALCAPYILK